MKIIEVIFFPNGNAAALDDHGQQITKYQRSWLILFIEFLQSKGLTIGDIININFKMPNGRKAKLMKAENTSDWIWGIK